MKILVVCQYYYPEPFRLSDLCEEMVKRGHKVTVLTGTPNYPMGSIYKGYEKGRKNKEIINGVHVIRCRIIPRKKGTFFRLLNYFSYAISAWFKVARLDKDFDVVFTNQLSPIMMCWPAMRYAKKFKKQVIMYCLDLWPASLIVGGVKPNSLIYRFFNWISRHIYQKMDKILVSSRMFMDYLNEKFNIDMKKMKYLPQYAEDLFEDIKYKNDDGNVNLLFAGNVGVAQSLDTIIGAAKSLPDVNFHIVGDGVELDRLKALAGKNVIFYGRKPINEMPDFYAKADAMLVTLQSDLTLSYTLPGKVQTYMAAGKPIIGAANGETKKVIDEAKCGYCGRAENIDELANNIKKFIQSANKEMMARNSRSYYDNFFERNKFMDRLERELRD